jgi:hypothetical protein
VTVFEHPDLSEGFRCPVCGTGRDGPVLKVPRDWDHLGFISTTQVHVACLDLRLYPRLDTFVIRQDLQLRNEDL